MASARRSRSAAIYFARHNDWTRAFAHTESAKTVQTKADEYFEDYLDALALDDVCDNDPTTLAVCENCEKPAPYDSELILCTALLRELHVLR